MANAKWSDKAEWDVVECALFIGAENADAAHRFARSARGTAEWLTQTPLVGAQREVSCSRLAGLRSWPVKGFENWLIFYRPVDGGIEVIRVLHGARDLDSVLEAEDL